MIETTNNGIESSRQGLSQDYKALYHDACTIIEETRQRAYHAVNVSLTIRNWLLGERIAKDELDGADRAKYGKGLVKMLAQDLSSKYGKGFDFSSLYQYIRFYRMFPEILDSVRPKSGRFNFTWQDTEILDLVRPKSPASAPALLRLLPWTHYRELIRVEHPEARRWYEQEALRREIEMQKEVFRQQQMDNLRELQ